MILLLFDAPEEPVPSISMADDEGQKVLLYVYDLSQGFAAQVSQAVLGKHVSSSDEYS